MNGLLQRCIRRSEFARSLDRTVTLQTPAVQIRDHKKQLILSVSADIHVTYRIIHSKKFSNHYMDYASFEAALVERLKVSGSSALGDALSDKDRSCFAKESIRIGQLVKELVSSFTSVSGVLVLNCNCVPVVGESFRLDDLEYKQKLKEIDPTLLIGEFLSQAGAGAMSGINPVMNALWGKAINPTPQYPKKDEPFI